jgi:lysozyme family protein
MITKPRRILRVIRAPLEADFNAAGAIVIKDEGGYQNDPADNGNFYQGVNYGTKYGITPGAFVSHYKTIQSDTIKNLTIPKALPIYKVRYWDKIRGDEIANNSVAELMLFVIVNSGTGQIKSLKQIVNQVAGKNLLQVSAAPFTSAEIKILNSIPQDRYFDAIKKFREQFYRALVVKQPQKQKFLKGWLNRLNKHKYSGAVSSGTGSLGRELLGTGLLLGAIAGISYGIDRLAKR